MLLRSVLAVLLVTAPMTAHAGAAQSAASRNIAQRQFSPLGSMLRQQRAFLIKQTRKKPAGKEGIGARAADGVTKFAGSWKFISSFSVGMAAWIAWNTFSGHAFDPAPFIGLNLLLSTVAALQAPFILMSSNRQAEKDRIRQEEDLRVNILAEQEIRGLHGKIDELSGQMKLLSDRLGAERTAKSSKKNAARRKD